MSDAYQTKRFTYEGREFEAAFYDDPDMGAPWEEHDGHGPVRAVKSERDKRPGERMMTSRGGMVHAYDWAEAMKLAKRDGWGLNEADEAKLAASLGCKPTRAQMRAEAVRLDFEHMQGWLYEYWHWCGIAVRIIGPDGDPQGGEYENALWGIESDTGNYWQHVAHDLASQILHVRRAHWRAALHEARERRYWASRDINTKG